MKLILLAIFSIFPILQVNASTPKAATCTRTEYREEYIPGTKSSPGYVRNYEIDVEIFNDFSCLSSLYILNRTDNNEIQSLLNE